MRDFLFDYFCVLCFNSKQLGRIMKKLAILIFSLFIVGVSYAEDCSQTSDGCWQLISNNPTQLLCSNLLVTTMTEGCRNVCAAGAVYSGTNCACDNGFYRTLGGGYSMLLAILAPLVHLLGHATVQMLNH